VRRVDRIPVLAKTIAKDEAARPGGRETVDISFGQPGVIERDSGGLGMKLEHRQFG